MAHDLFVAGVTDGRDRRQEALVQARGGPYEDALERLRAFVFAALPTGPAVRW